MTTGLESNCDNTESLHNRTNEEPIGEDRYDINLTLYEIENAISI